MIRCVLVGSLALLEGLPAWAQNNAALDAGALRQQIEQQRGGTPLPPRVLTPSAAPLPPPAAASDLGVEVRRFDFVGNSLLTAAELERATAGFLGRMLGFAELQQAAGAVAAAYRQAGRLARVYLPEQDVSEGVVRLEILEARLAAVKLEGPSSKHVDLDQILPYFTARQALGQPLDPAALDRALLLADDLPGVSVAGTLIAGEGDGETALVLQLADKAEFHGDLTLDNSGSRSTGLHRLSAQAHLSSPGRRGEQLSLSLLHTEGSDYGRLALAVPDGYDGLRWTFSVSEMNYRVIQGQAAAARVRGRSGSLGMELIYPLVRSWQRNLYLSAGVEAKSFFTQDTQVRSDYESSSLRLGVSANWADALAGGGASSASIHVHNGHLSAMQAHTLADVIPRHYRKFSYSLSREQTVTSRQSVRLSLSGQQALELLDSSERFYLGGADSVRAYPSSEHGGERGRLLSADWRWRMAPAWTGSAFADLGWSVALPAQAGQAPRRVHVQATGLALEWRHSTGWSGKLTWAHRLGSNPTPTAAGTDGDGTLKKNRLWLSTRLPF